MAPPERRQRVHRPAPWGPSTGAMGSIDRRHGATGPAPMGPSTGAMATHERRQWVHRPAPMGPSTGAMAPPDRQAPWRHRTGAPGPRIFLAPAPRPSVHFTRAVPE